MKIRSSLATIVTLGVLFSAPAAYAQSKGVTTTGNDRDYGYKFDDDSLSVGNAGPGGLKVKVRPPPARTKLLKPRTKFIDELIRSITNI